MTQHQTVPARTVPPALVAVVAVVFGLLVLRTLVSAVGLTGVVMLTGVLGSFGFVALTLSRRRPISTD